MSNDTGSCTGNNSTRARILFHIGYHKTGTSWLRQGLFQSADTGFFQHDPTRTTLHGLFVKQDPLSFDRAWARRQCQSYLDRAERDGMTFVVSHPRLSGYPASGG